jgi:tRNA(Arg) A34 adenosine deaminase TadA
MAFGVSYQVTPLRLSGKSWMTKTNHFMELALAEARAAGTRDEVPIGAVVVLDNVVIGKAGNRTRELNDVTAHAEIAAIRMACAALGQERLTGADLYVTLEPCTMCAAAISFARIRRLYYGAEDPKGGAVDNGVRFYGQPTCHHAPEVYSGLAEKDAGDLLTAFFQMKRTEG